MKRFNNFRRLLRAAAVVTAVAAMTFAGCTKVDDTLGSNLVPDNQQMKAGYQTFGALTLTGDLNPRRYVETRLYQTDSLITSNLTYGYMGSMLSDTFGLRTAGFLTQYVPYEIDSGYFGFRPILDSAIILLSISSYGSDTLTSQEYNVYEVVSNKYLTEKPVESGKSERDTTFYLNFDPVKAGVVGDDVLFTFTFPDGKTTGPATTYTTMKPTPKGREFINRLMLQEGTYKGDYSIYSLDSLEQWVAEFKGLYIVPAVDQTTPNKGNIYATSLDASGFAIYGRNRLESDPTLIADTISIPYIFYDSSVDYGNVSVNTIRHDYSKATSPQRFDIADAVETNENRPLSKQVYVEGMGGVVTEMTFTEEFFRQLAQIIKDENAASAKEFNTLARNFHENYLMTAVGLFRGQQLRLAEPDRREAHDRADGRLAEPPGPLYQLQKALGHHRLRLCLREDLQHDADLRRLHQPQPGLLRDGHHGPRAEHVELLPGGREGAGRERPVGRDRGENQNQDYVHGARGIRPLHPELQCDAGYDALGRVADQGGCPDQDRHRLYPGQIKDQQHGMRNLSTHA